MIIVDLDTRRCGSSAERNCRKPMTNGQLLCTEMAHCCSAGVMDLGERLLQEFTRTRGDQPDALQDDERAERCGVAEARERPPRNRPWRGVRSAPPAVPNGETLVMDPGEQTAVVSARNLAENGRGDILVNNVFRPPGKGGRRDEHGHGRGVEERTISAWPG
ncbi:hypothetical protein ACWEVP_02905 [Amycolatopsis sp. NPDC003865]